MINFLASASFDICTGDLKWIVQIIKIVIRIICLAAPFALILFGSLDFFKAIIAGDEKEMKAKRKPFIGRLVAAIIILLLPALINLIMKTIAGSAQNTFVNCWNDAGNSWNVNIPDYSSNGNLPS